VAAEICRQFDVDDPYQLKLKALEAAGKNATSPGAYAIGAVQAAALAERAAAEGKGAVASRAAAQAVTFARKTKDKELIVQADRCKAALREQTGRTAAYQKALKKVATDAEAKLAAGKYEVLVLGDRKEGLAKLASSGDPRYADIARLELEVQADLSQWAPLSMAWWQVSAAEEDSYYRTQCQLQAKYCYLRAAKVGRAGGVSSPLAAEIKSVPDYPLSRLRPGVAARYFDGADFQQKRIERAEAAIDFYYGEGSPDPAIPRNFFSARWTGFLNPPLAGRYLLVLFTNDSVRLWVDGKQVLDRWGQNAKWQQVELELTSGPHAFRMDYNDTFEIGVAMLGWTLAAFPDPDQVQWSPIDALYYDPDSPFDLPE
jgi:hypothetical protein